MYPEQHTHSAPSSWNDFNDAEAQQSGFDLIPKGSLTITTPVTMCCVSIWIVAMTGDPP